MIRVWLGRRSDRGPRWSRLTGFFILIVDPLLRRAIVQSVLGSAFFVAIVFGSARTWAYWQGWTFLTVFEVSTISFGVYLGRHDRALLERRMNAGPWNENERAQKIIVSLVMLAFAACILLSVLDYRQGVSPVPAWVALAGNAVVAVSFLFIFTVLRVNTWAASNVAVEKDQQVVDTGPYACVRHPMYAGAAMLFAGMPLALGAWRPIVLLIPFLVILAWRLLDEETVLARELPGYVDYMSRVRYRLVPFVW